ncbi:MAG: protein kinase domain-containing protein [Phototrophicaceae bacterium]
MSETLLNGRYRLKAQQGSGGMAVIYRAIDQELDRVVAVKILRPSLTPNPEFSKRFRDEAKNVARLTHPNIVTVYDVGTDGQTLYMVMEFIDGSDLKKLIRAEAPFNYDLAVNFAIQICAGIGYAHRNNLVHADVKPQNVLLTSQRMVKVTDFGIAQAMSDATLHGEKQDVVWGSPHYFAPEQAQGERPSPASDVYSIAVVLFEMLTGQLPYLGSNQQELAMAHIKAEIPHVKDFVQNIPDNLDKLIHRAMSKDPQQRFRNADQFGQVLAGYREVAQQQTVVGTPPNSFPVQPPSPQVVQPPAGNRPLYNNPTPPAHPMSSPTQQYSAVPEAPSAPVYGKPANPRFASESYSKPAYGTTAEEFNTSTSNPQLQRTAGMPAQSGGSGVDVITIILAFLAFVAVACLIPLYILLAQAYL